MLLSSPALCPFRRSEHLQSPPPRPSRGSHRQRYESGQLCNLDDIARGDMVLYLGEPTQKTVTELASRSGAEGQVIVASINANALDHLAEDLWKQPRNQANARIQLHHLPNETDTLPMPDQRSQYDRIIVSTHALRLTTFKARFGKLGTALADHGKVFVTVTGGFLAKRRLTWLAETSKPSGLSVTQRLSDRCLQGMVLEKT